MPSVALVNKYSLESRPHHLALNCNTTLLSVIDVTGLLQFVDLGENNSIIQIVRTEFGIRYSLILRLQILFSIRISDLMEICVWRLYLRLSCAYRRHPRRQ